MAIKLFVSQQSSYFRLPSADNDYNKAIRRKYDHFKSLEHRTVVRQQGLLGRGLFAAEDIPKGKYIVEYVGELVSTQEFLSRSEVYKNRSYTNDYFAHLHEDWHLDATMTGNNGRYANHSCFPNARFKVKQLNGSVHYVLFLKSKKFIKKGEPVTLDYCWYRSTTEAIDLSECRCSPKHCRGYI